MGYDEEKRDEERRKEERKNGILTVNN